MTSPISNPFSRFALAGPHWWRSLNTRVTLFALAIFIISLWSLAFYASRELREDIQRVLGEQQSSTVSVLAAEVNQELDDRLGVLEKVAGRITPNMMGNSATLQAFLEERLILQGTFNTGVIALGLDGIAIADLPRSAGRIGINFKDRDFIQGALKEGKATIGRPVIDKVQRTPIFVIAVPIRDAQGKLIGALAGATNLGLPNFLDKISASRYGKTGGYLLIEPQSRLVVTATDKSRIMEALPAPGVSPWIDRVFQGYEGTDIFTNPLGLKVLTSVKAIPVAGWIMVSALPTAEAFAPIDAMQQRMLLAALFLTLLAGSLTWLMLRRQLSPMLAAVNALTAQSNTNQPLQPLPITSQDEIGELIGGFNRLLDTLGHREETLKKSESSFRNLFEKNSSVMLLIEPSSGNIVNVNVAAVAYYGYPRDRLIGMCINEINTQPPELIAEERLMALREERSYVLFPHRLASGEVRDVEVHTTPIETDGRPLLLSIVHDITERKQLEETLKESELRYRTVANFTSDWEYWVLPDGTLRYVSPSCEQISGYSADEFYADPQLLTRIIHPEDQPLYTGHTHHLSAKGIPEPIDYRIRTKNGEIRWISHICRPVHDPDGQALGQRASNRDSTERKQAEEELRRSSAELEQKTRAITRTNADLQRFAEVTAHHLQEPVRRMATYAERLTQQLSDRLDDEEARLSLEFIGQQARREQNLLRDVERYLAADRPRGEVKALDAGKAVTEILARMAERIGSAGAEVTLGNLPPALIDAPRLDDTFVVALENALGHGRGEQPLRIAIEGQRLGDQVRYSISDNGPGVKEEYREQVFGIFERLSAGNAGTGVGLAILRRVVESCDGRAWIEEAPGGGCCILFELPSGELP